MERVNIDYISVVRLLEGRLHYEKMPIKKSEALIESLESMACDEHCTIEHMETAFICSPLFKYMAEPYYYALTYADSEAYEANRMVELLEPFSEVKTKTRFLDAAVKVIEECDCRLSLIDIKSRIPDIIFYSCSDYDERNCEIVLTDNTMIVTHCDRVGDGKTEGVMEFTVIHKGSKVLPYRSLVEFYECSPEIMNSTRKFDADSLQWDNYIKALVATGNEIIECEAEFLHRAVVEDGQLMMDKMKLLLTDRRAYYDWLRWGDLNLQVEYSKNSQERPELDISNVVNKEVFELSVIGEKLTSALYLSESLEDWSKLDDAYSCFSDAFKQMTAFVSPFLEGLNKACAMIPATPSEDQKTLLEIAGVISGHLESQLDRINRWYGLEESRNEL